MIKAIVLNLVCCSMTALAQDDSIKSYTTARLQGEPPRIDGYFNDAAWEQVPWGGGDFREHSPDPGGPPSVQTYFKILYDARNLYVAFRNLDPEPGKIVSRMSRRDGFEGDFVEINIDSYYDKRSAFSFTASVSGVKGDEYVSNNGSDWDADWDPIWYVQTRINEEGWAAEIRIPLSQLRFADKPEHTWGLQITRRFFRKGERSNWQYIPPDASGWVHLFGDLKGIRGIKPQKQLEIQPYLVAKAERFQEEEGNPFMTGSSSGVDGGLDAKIGLTSDITLDLSLNPDFGQVEADPSQVNLSAFQLFFQERRPFFIEGNNTLNFPLTDFWDNNLFYSRRIGRAPQAPVDTDKYFDDEADEYVSNNRNTTILGAAKLTGKNKRGFSWGILESVTSAEKVKVDSLGFSSHVTVEPLTNYVVARAQQDIHKGNTIVGAMFTATNRQIDGSRLNWLHSSAYTGGVDFMHSWKDRTYFISAKGILSRVTGGPEAITHTQTAAERYFQRPDNKHAHVDSTSTSLTGTGGTLVYGKRSGKLVYEAGYTWLSPQLELNDVGFLTQTDQQLQWIWLQYRILTPVGIFRSMRFNAVQYRGWDFDRNNTSAGYNADGILSFKNFWTLETGSEYEPKNISNADLRGGPALRYPGTISYFFNLGTDSRKKFQVFLNPQFRWGFNSYKRNTTLEVDFTYKPVNALSIVVSPSISSNKDKLQYVTTESLGNETRYIVAEIDQTIARVSLRMTYMITPNLSLQYWGQPFGASGKYTGFKSITTPGASVYRNRFTPLPETSLTLTDDDYAVDENNDGVTDYTFENPDFNFGQFRSNMVVRWEYIPGSTVFLVWTQEMNGTFYDQAGPLHEKYTFQFDDKAHNIFLMKFTYRFIL